MDKEDVGYEVNGILFSHEENLSVWIDSLPPALLPHCWFPCCYLQAYSLPRAPATKCHKRGVFNKGIYYVTLPEARRPWSISVLTGLVPSDSWGRIHSFPLSWLFWSLSISPPGRLQKASVLYMLPHKYASCHLSLSLALLQGYEASHFSLSSSVARWVPSLPAWDAREERSLSKAAHLRSGGVMIRTLCVWCQSCTLPRYVTTPSWWERKQFQREKRQS